MSQKIHPGFLTFFPERLRYIIFNQFLHVLIYARLQIFIQLSPTLQIVPSFITPTYDVYWRLNIFQREHPKFWPE